MKITDSGYGSTIWNTQKAISNKRLLVKFIVAAGQFKSMAYPPQNLMNWSFTSQIKCIYCSVKPFQQNYENVLECAKYYKKFISPIPAAKHKTHNTQRNKMTTDQTELK